MDKSKTKRQLLLEIEELRTRLEEAEETLRAIRSGEVDALVVADTQGERVYTLQGADRSYRILLETMEEGAATLGNDGIILYCNRRLATMLEAPIEKVTGSSIGDYLLPADWEKFSELLKEGNEVRRSEFELQTIGGNRVPANLSLGSLPGTGMPGFCLTAADLTGQKRVEEALRTAHAELEERVKERTKELSEEIEERKRAEEALRESEQRWATTLASIGDAVIATDAGGRITFMNLVAEDLTGWPLREASRQPVPGVFHIINEFTRQTVEDPVAKVLKAGAIVGLANHTILVRKDGTEVPIDDSGAPIRDLNGKTTGVVLIFRDISERREAEIKIRRQTAVVEGINRIFEEALNSRTEEELGKVCLAVAEEVSGSKFGFIGRVDAEGIYDIAISNPGWAACKLTDSKGHFQPPGSLKIHGIYGRVIQDGKGFFTNDPSSHPDRIGLPPGHPPLESFLGVPLISDGRTMGMIAVGNRDGGYGPEDLEAVESLGPAIVEAFQRKRAEEELRESEERFRNLVKYAPAAIYEMDLQGTKFFSVNDAMCDVTKYSSKELLSMKPIDFLDQESGSLFQERIRKTLAGEEIDETVEYRIRRKDGEWIYAKINAGALTYTKGKPSRVVVIAYDVTERKKIEEALRQSEERYRQLVQHAPAGIYEVDFTTGRFTEANDAMSLILGYTHDELLAMTPFDILDDEGRARFASRIRLARSGERLEEATEYLVRTKDGRLIWSLLSVTFRWDGGKIVGATVIAHDITERKRIEEEIRRSRNELGLRVQERTAELAKAFKELQEEMEKREKAEQQLRQVQKLEAIGTLTGGIAHDFNNILGAVVINSEMALLDLPGGSGLRSNLDLILKAGLRGKDLVKQMLLFSRKSEKKQEVLTLTPLIKETFKLLRSTIPTTIEMKLLLETESDSVSADPSQIQQVVMNLCTNAAYAMKGTTGSIDISLQGISFGSNDLPEADMEPGDYLVLSVKDTGFGMDEEVKKRIFEPFFTTKPVGEGTGLGLSVVYGIVKNHKGNITVYSEPGKGSIFKIYFPRVDTRTSVTPEAPKPIPRGNERILLVDDEDFNIKTVQNMLQHLGYKVTALMDSQEALRLFSENPSQFDLVITDQTMPFLTGEDLGKEFMRMRPGIPVILCTGYSDLISSEKAAALGFHGYIMKPFTIREGAELVRRVLDQKEANSRSD